MQCPKAVFFDLDDTLAPSFENPSPEIVGKLLAVLDSLPVAIITGRDFPWMARDFLPQIARSPHVERFFVFPEGAAQCLQWNGSEWRELYAESITDAERQVINGAILESVKETGVLAIAKKLPAYDVMMGGATSTDVTKKGVNKAYGVRWLSERLGVHPADMLYVGDALYPGGNDYVVVPSGIVTRATKGPAETLKIIDELLLACATRT